MDARVLWQAGWKEEWLDPAFVSAMRESESDPAAIKKILREAFDATDKLHTFMSTALRGNALTILVSKCYHLYCVRWLQTH